MKSSRSPDATRSSSNRAMDEHDTGGATAERPRIQPERPRCQVVVVTGASAGVGRATALAYASRGAAIGLIARGEEALHATAREVAAAGGIATVFPADVAHADRIEQAADQIERELGPIDVWINNAMVSVFSPVIETTAEEYRRVTEVTYLGCVHGTLSALRRMRP